MVISDPPTHEASAFIHYGETRRRDRSVVRDLGLLKSNSALWRFGWRWWRIEDLHDLLQDLHDRSFMDVQPGSELFLKCSQLPRKLRRAAKGLAHFDESADDENAHLNGSLAAKNVRALQCAMLSKRVGEGTPTTAAWF